MERFKLCILLLYMMKESKEVRGIVANKGYVYGAVRIILSEEDIKKVQYGDVIIMDDLKQNMIDVIKDCVALITDKGDINSYSAKVCKERGLPCIIGTLRATKVFNDDELVFVDAENGIVRKD